MNPQDPYATPSQNTDQTNARVGNELTVTQPGETTICSIKRHPVGIITIYVGITILVSVAALLCLALIPNALGSGNVLSQGAAVAFVLLAAISLVYGLLATRIYWGNSWVVTSDSVTQVSQSGLFDRQSSQLALHNIEDVTVEQNGLLSHIFNYGVLKAETAGHHSKFVFPYCPNPNYYAQKILSAREALGGQSHH